MKIRIGLNRWILWLRRDGGFRDLDSPIVQLAPDGSALFVRTMLHTYKLRFFGPEWIGLTILERIQ